MTENILERLFEHNNWANAEIIRACSTLSDEQLDAEPKSATKGSIRLTLWHLVEAQQSYLSLLTLPIEKRVYPPIAFTEFEHVASASGEVLLAMAKGERKPVTTPLQTEDGYYVEPWVVLVQVINHATEHREQINNMLTALGVTPLDLDGWTFGNATSAIVPIPKE